MPKRLWNALGAAVFCALLCLPTRAGAVSTSAQAAILMEAGSGRVLYAQGEHQRLPIASTTKLMTALVAAERCPDLSATVTVDPAAVGVEGSSLYLKAGEQRSLEELLYGLLLHSGNDAAVAIAVHCAGDVETFVGWMNEKAQALGMADTHFENPNGLDAPTHYSSAYDLALLGRAVLENDALAAIAATRSVTLGARSYANHNKLLWRYPGCVGLKTGYTQTAGRTLVSAARRGETTLVAVTLNDGNDWADHAGLFDYGFGLCRSQLLARGGKVVGTAKVAGSVLPGVEIAVADEVRYPLLAGEQVAARWELPKALTAPVLAGDRVGAVIFTLDGREIGRSDLVAARWAPRNAKG